MKVFFSFSVFLISSPAHAMCLQSDQTPRSTVNVTYVHALEAMSCHVPAVMLKILEQSSDRAADGCLVGSKQWRMHVRKLRSLKQSCNSELYSLLSKCRITCIQYQGARRRTPWRHLCCKTQPCRRTCAHALAWVTLLTSLDLHNLQGRVAICRQQLAAAAAAAAPTVQIPCRQ